MPGGNAIPSFTPKIQPWEKGRALLHLYFDTRNPSFTPKFFTRRDATCTSVLLDYDLVHLISMSGRPRLDATVIPLDFDLGTRGWSSSTE
jgi:hypothetical protein